MLAFNDPRRPVLSDDRTHLIMTPWTLAVDRWDPALQPRLEALTALGNGRFVTRGAAEESRAGGPHYPGTYLAGGYNRLESEVAGRVVSNECLVNWPNWLPLSFRIDGGEWFSLDTAQILAYRQELDVRRGVLERKVHLRDQGDREFDLVSRRFVSMDRHAVAALEWTLTPREWSGTLEIRSAIDGRVANTGVERYRTLDGQHLDVLATGQVGEDAVFLTSQTNESRQRVCQAVRTRAFAEQQIATATRRLVDEQDGVVAQHLEIACEARKPLRIEKVLALRTGRDVAVGDPEASARKLVRRLPDVADLLADHERAWRHLWDRADLVLSDGDSDEAQLILRLHIFHILQTASRHVIDADVGIPARGLHGEAYRGHIFWDELFVFPFLNLRIPELTRALLKYRHRRLDEARHAARQEGYRGAMFPWQSGQEGEEESQVVHLNPESGEWVPDTTHRQRHVAVAIATNVWQYHLATDDREFLADYGAELLLEIARFWASAVTFDPDRERYEIHNVVGPDEFHTAYPGQEDRGLDNSAYTNIMAVWCLRTARRALELLPQDRRRELMETIDISEEDFAVWRDIEQRMFVPMHGDGLISQFEGWDDLEELDWKGLRERHGDIQRLDRILGAEGDDPNRYKATKQADVLMLFYLLSAGELEELLTGMGYAWDHDLIPRNVAYYLDRTSHGSTLSRVVHAWVLARSDRRASWDLFCDALRSDVADVQGGTTSEGIHMGAMAGTVDLVQRCYAGVSPREDGLWLHPQLPRELTGLEFRVRYRSQWLDVRIEADELEVSVDASEAGPMRIGHAGELHDVAPGTSRRFPLDRSAD
jgi:trehalose/maltose hydrolase-like predicted phosphorylase